MGFLQAVRDRFSGSAAPARPQPRSGFFRNDRSPFLMGWRPQLRETSDDIGASWQVAAARAVESVQNSGFIAGTVETSTASVVGKGLALSCRPDSYGLGLSEKQGNDWAERVETAWTAWATSPEECDASGRLTFHQMQQLSYASWLSFGEAVALMPMLRRRGGSFTKVLMMPPSRLAMKSDGQRLIQGVQVDGFGAAQAYHFLRRWPDGQLGDLVLPRYDRDGRQQVAHVFAPGIQTTRGISPLAPVLKVVRQIDQFCDATLTAALIQTIFAATIKTEFQGLAAFEGLMTEGDQKDQGALSLSAFAGSKADWYDTAKVDLSSHGRIAHLFPNDTLEFHSSKHPSAQHDQFMQWLCREVARCAGVTYEAATGDYRNATYSSVRMATAEMWGIVLTRRANIPATLSQQVYEVWLEDMIGSGQLEFPGGLSAFLGNRRAACRASWTGPPKPQADDLKTARANQTLIQMGVSSLETVCEEYGTDWKAEMERRARERQYAKELGLPDPHPFPEDPSYKRAEQGTAEDKTDDPGYMPEGG